MKFEAFTDPSNKNGDRFVSMMQSLKTYRDLYFSKEALLSLLLSLGIVTIFLINMKKYDNGAIMGLVGIALGGDFGILGFLIGGLALTIGSISDELINITEVNNKAEKLLNLIFRFYFVGVIVGTSSLILLIVYLVLSFRMTLSPIWWGIVILLASYIFFFGLIGSIMLMGTNIRIFLLRTILHKK